MSKKRVKISTLVVDSLETRSDLSFDFEITFSQGIPAQFASPFYYLRSCAGVMNDENETVDAIHDICLKVEDHLFYCHKVKLHTYFSF